MQLYILHILKLISLVPHLLQIPGGKIVEGGLTGVTKSDNPLFAGLLLALLILSYIGFICVVKYLIKDKKEALATQLVSNAEKHAIDIGAQQLVLKGKDEVIKTLVTENEYLKDKTEKLSEDRTMILRDNAEIFRQVGVKIGQLTDAQVATLGEVKQGHSDMKLFIIEKVNITPKS